MGAGGSTGNLRWMALTVTGLTAAVATPLVWAALTTGDHPEALPGRIVEVTSTTTTTTLPHPTTTAVAADHIEVEELPGGYARVVAGDQGILLATPDGSLPFRRLTWEPTFLAFGIGEGRVVHQGYGDETTGPIVVSDALAEHELFAPGRSGPDSTNLQDAGFVGGRPYALVSTYTTDAEDDRDVRLVLVDLETYRQLDLGSVGRGQRYVDSARLLPGGDVVVLLGDYEAEGHVLERRRVDGSTAWSVPVAGDADRTVTLHRDGDDLEVVVLEPTSHRSPHHPRLGVRRFDPASGAETAPRDELRLDLPDGYEVPRAVCSKFAEAVGGTLLCDANGSAPLRIDLVTGGAAPERHAPPEGTMTFWRFA